MALLTCFVTMYMYVAALVYCIFIVVYIVCSASVIIPLLGVNFSSDDYYSSGKILCYFIA